jgi:hypothetical protein
MNNPYVQLGQQVLPMVKNTADTMGGPFGVLGKVIGLGEAEVKAGIPYWGWAGIGFVLGAMAAYALKDKIERLVP